MGRIVDRRTDGRPTDGRPTEGQTDGWTAGRMDGRPDGRTDGWTEGRTDGWTEGRTDGWTDGRPDGWTDGRTDGRHLYTMNVQLLLAVVSYSFTLLEEGSTADSIKVFVVFHLPVNLSSSG